MTSKAKQEVALIRVGRGSDRFPHAPEVGVRDHSGDRWYVAGPRLGSQHGWYDSQVEVVRHLAVIDPEDPRDVSTLIEEWDSARVHAATSSSVAFTRAASALRRYATPRDPEPTGLGAVVVDTDGRRWVHIGGGHWASRLSDRTAGYGVGYGDIRVAEIKSEGVS